MKSPALIIGIAALALAAGAMAQGPGYGMRGGYGPMMGGGYGPGMGRGYGPGNGPGMGGGYGPGYGRGAPAAADLSDAQRDKVRAIQDEHRRANADRASELRTEQFKLRDLYAAKAEPSAIAAQQKKVDGIREQMFRDREQMRSEMDAVLGR